MIYVEFIYWLIIIIALYLGVPFVYKKYGVNRCVIFLYAIGLFVFFPVTLYSYGSEYTASVPVMVGQLFVLNIGGNEIVELITNYHLKDNAIFTLAIWSTYIMCPFITVQAVLSFIRNKLKKTILKFTFNKNIHIFTERNENSVLLAKDIMAKDKKSYVIFTDSSPDENEKHFLGISLKLNEAFNLINPTNNIDVFFTDEDEDLKLDKLMYFLSSNSNKELKIYVLTSRKITEEVIDNFKKNNKNARIIVLNTDEILSRKILWNYPLYLNMAKKEELNVTVIGVGETGGTFASNVLWCGQLPECKLYLNLVDKEGSTVFKNIGDNLDPADFNTEIFSYDAQTNEFLNDIKDTRIINSDYIFVALPNDDMNISISKKLRLFFLRCGKKPYITTLVRNDSKYKTMKEILKEEEITLVGGKSEFYTSNVLLNDKLFNIAFEVYKIVEEKYGNIVNERDFYNQSHIDIYSSYANAVHTKYKAFAITGESDTLTYDKIKEKVDSNHHLLSVNEHDRWVAFEKLKGYIGFSGTEEELIEFLKSNKNSGRKVHKNDDIKIHACITDFDGVEKLDKLIVEKEFKKESNLKEIDELIASKTAELWQKGDIKNV